MSACKLSGEQLETGFRSLQHMDNTEVTEPQTGFKIPTPARIKRLAVNNIPQYYSDWKWLNTLQHFEDIDVWVGGIGEETGRLHVHDVQAEWINITDNNAVPILVNVLSNLPTNFKDKVYIQTNYTIMVIVGAKYVTRSDWEIRMVPMERG